VLIFQLYSRACNVSFTLFVALTDLYGAIRCFEADAGNNELVTGLPIRVPWEDWGRRSTRLAEGSNRSEWVCYVYMHRFVFQTPEEEDDWGSISYIYLLDFNPYAIVGQPRGKHGASTWGDLSYLGEGFSGLSLTEAVYVGNEDGKVLNTPDDEWPPGSDKPRTSKDHRISGEMEVYSEPSILNEGIFSHKVITELPFRMVAHDRPIGGSTSPMIDAERILLARSHANWRSSLEAWVI